MLQNDSLDLLFLIKARGILGLFLNVQIFFALFPDLIWIFQTSSKISFEELVWEKRLSKTLNGYQCLTLINVHAPTWLLLFLHVGVFISFKSEQINILTPTEICIMEAVYFIGDRTSAHWLIITPPGLPGYY